MADERKTIVIVDDEADARAFVQTIVEETGDFRILTAADGDAAIKMIQEEVPDLVVLDVMMPEMDGFEVLAEMRKDSKAANVDMAFLGVGALDDIMSYMMSEFFMATGGMTIDEIRKKAIGDILYHIIDKKGQIVDQHYDDFLCSIELDVLRGMVSEGKRVVLVTHSGRKEISRAVIEAHLVNFVMVDDVLARGLLEDA